MSKEIQPSLAKNTAILYFRMLFQMAVYLYTSRIIVSSLGLSDWGIYDVVAGIIVIVTFLNNSMTVCTQRYLTYAIGKRNNDYLNKVFSASLSIHIIIALFIIIVGETIGFFYVYNYINIPEGRHEAAVFVYHCSLISTAIMVATVPYNALTIAYERISAFAIISISDVMLKLLITIGISYSSIDRLKLYAFLLLIEMIAIRSSYIFYQKNKLKNISLIKQHHFLFWKDPDNNAISNELYKEMLAFSGWSILGNLSVVCNTQGLNILLNLVGGAMLNAARAISFQVQTAITAFVSSFQTAINPRITKCYASGDLGSMLKLVFTSSRISFMLIFIIALPLLIETDFILRIWLTSIPDKAVSFTRLFILVAIIDSIANPLTIAASATGKIKQYHICIGSTLLIVLPIAALTMRFQKIPELIFVIQILFVIIAQMIRIQLCHNLIGLKRMEYMKQVMTRIIIVGTLSPIIPIALKCHLTCSMLHSIIVLLATVLSTGICIIAFGLESREREMITNKVKNTLNRDCHEKNNI